MSEFFDLSIASPTETSEAVDIAVDIVRNEMLVVIPTDTVYGIGADAFSHEAVQELLDAKGRGRNMPPPVLIPGVNTVDGVAAEISDEARLLMSNFWPGALTLILWAQPSLQWDLGDTEGTVAVRVPSHHVALDVLRQTGPLAVTSANRTGQDTARTASEAREIFGPQVGAYLELGELGPGEPSTIIDCTRTPHRVVRSGALSLETLREVVPELVDETAGASPASQAASGQDPSGGVDEAEPLAKAPRDTTALAAKAPMAAPDPSDRVSVAPDAEQRSQTPKPAASSSRISGVVVDPDAGDGDSAFPIAE